MESGFVPYGADSGRGSERSGRVKNKNPAPIQISAEQLLREAVERQEVVAAPPKQQIADADELAEYQFRKRSTFEQQVKIQKQNMQVWIRYASFEGQQREFERYLTLSSQARSGTHPSVAHGPSMSVPLPLTSGTNRFGCTMSNSRCGTSSSTTRETSLTVP